MAKLSLEPGNLCDNDIYIYILGKGCVSENVNATDENVYLKCSSDGTVIKNLHTIVTNYYLVASQSLMDCP